MGDPFDDLTAQPRRIASNADFFDRRAGRRTVPGSPTSATNDGSSVAITGAIWVVNADGTGERQDHPVRLRRRPTAEPHPREFDTGVAWAPHGRRLAFNAHSIRVVR